MTQSTTDGSSIDGEIDVQSLAGTRLGPYCSFNPVSRVQIWQWCNAMGDRNPLYLDAAYQQRVGISKVTAPPAMMQMWTMRDVHMTYAPGSTDAAPYQIFDTLAVNGFPGNVAVSYDIQFHRYLVEGEQAHHYTTVVAISDLKTTGLGVGYFVTERVEYLDQDEALFAEALITYFQYRPTEDAQKSAAPASSKAQPSTDLSSGNSKASAAHVFTDIGFDDLTEGQPLPELVIPITHRLIVSGAAATQDYIDVHHNAPVAVAAGMPDIFMNILTTSGLCARYLSDWAGPASRLKSMKFNLLAPNTPGDTMTMQGQVSALQSQADNHSVTVDFGGKNNMGFHVTGTATLEIN